MAPASTSVLWLSGRASELVTRRSRVRQLLLEVLRFFFRASCVTNSKNIFLNARIIAQLCVILICSSRSESRRIGRSEVLARFASRKCDPSAMEWQVTCTIRVRTCLETKPHARTSKAVSYQQEQKPVWDRLESNVLENFCFWSASNQNTAPIVPNGFSSKFQGVDELKTIHSHSSENWTAAWLAQFYVRGIIRWVNLKRCPTLLRLLTLMITF